MKRPVGYLRKSRVTSDRHVSWEVQEREIRALAERHGDADLDLMSDWGKSGRGERTKYRAEYLRLRQMIEADEVSVLYAYSLSRLSRSLTEYASLAKLCEVHNVRVRLCKEGEFDYSSPSGRFNVGILALLAQMEAELAQERARDTLTARKARGDHIGSAGYGKRLKGGKLQAAPDEDVSAIAAAYHEAGSFSGAAKLLNERGVATKTKGATKWAQTSVARVLRREGLAPAARSEQAGVRMRGNYALSRLLICPCGGVMTGRKTSHTTKYGTYGPYVSYQCFRGRYDDNHPRPYMVREGDVLPWVQAQVTAHLRTPATAPADVDTAAERTALEDRRRRLALEWVRSGLGEDAVQAELTTIGDELERLDRLTRIAVVPPIDWSWEPRELNAVLVLAIDHVQLGSDLRPVKTVPGVPEWWTD